MSFACDLLRAGSLEIIEIADHAGERVDLDEVTLFSVVSKLKRNLWARI